MEYQYFIGEKIFSISNEYEIEKEIYDEILNKIKMQFAEYYLVFIEKFAKKINNLLSIEEINEIRKTLLNNFELKLNIVEGRWGIIYKEKFGSITIKQLTIFNNIPNNDNYNRKTSTLDFCFDMYNPTGVWCRDLINFKAVKMFFDYNYELAEIFYLDTQYNNKGSNLSYADEGFKFQHRHIKNIEEIKVLLPELFVIGVYDFTSEDFNERYEYYNLIKY